MKTSNTIPELLRKQAVEALFTAKTFNNSWQQWKSEIQTLLGTNYSETDIINLGDNLSSIFKSTGAAGRSQGSLSGGGNAWESLVCWYINLCSIGSRVVAVKKMSLVPEPIRDAITVNFGNFSCNTESDITVIVFPDNVNYTSELESKLEISGLNSLVRSNFNDFEIGIIQCKTNWNDNSQIPMLWDMIYSSGGFRGRNIKIGQNGFDIHHLKQFTYSFVTVPSNTRTTYKPTSVTVNRVTNLSGGNYWGQPSQQAISSSIKEIFKNYNSGFNTNIRTDIKNNIKHLNKELSYFKI